MTTEYIAVSETMYGSQHKEHRVARVFAAANTDEKLTPELRSRFVVLRFAPYALPDFLIIAERVLVDREKVDPGLAQSIAQAVWENLESKDIRDAVKVARLVSNFDDLAPIVQVLRHYK